MKAPPVATGIGLVWQFACTAVPLDFKAGAPLSSVGNAIIASALCNPFAIQCIL